MFISYFVQSCLFFLFGLCCTVLCSVFTVSISDNQYSMPYMCNKIYKTPNGGVGDLKAHYATHSRINDDLTGKRKRQILLTPLQSDDDPDNPVKVSDKSATKTNQPQKTTTQLLIPNLITNIMSVSGGPKAKIFTDSIIHYFVKDNVSFKTIENEGFKQMLQTICPLYKPPGRDTIARRIDDLYTVMASKFREELSKTETMQIRSFLSITTHLIQDGKLKTQNIGTGELFEGHTAIYIGHTLIETLQSWGLEAEKVVSVVTDSGANMKKAIVDEFGEKKHLPCVAHTINLVVEKAIDKTQEISKTGVKSGGVPVLLFKVREIVKYFKKSTKACDLLRNSQRVQGKKDGQFLKPVLDVRTRWNSSFYMIERFILLASHFSQVLLTESG
ncbi:hypothetical protein QTP88_026349 [Uroleucon formosanum]